MCLLENSVRCQGGLIDEPATVSGRAHATAPAL